VKKNTDKPLLSANISRRDFVNGTLVGVGAALMSSTTPIFAAGQTPDITYEDPHGDGYGGIGDYAMSNGNVASTRQAAHLIRDGIPDALLSSAEDLNEDYDMIIIGGGFSGIGAAYEFNKKYGDSKKCLILENHPIYGGEAKQNEFEVDGYKIYGPQGSNDFGPPDENGDDLIANIYRDTGLPFKFSYQDANPQSTMIRAPKDNYYGMYWDEERYDTGYFMGKDAKTPWIVNPRKDKLSRMPWSEEFKAELNRAFEDKEDYHENEGIDEWLDSMSYKDLLENVMGFSSKVTDYFDPIIAISMGGVCSDVYSAYSGKLLDMPGTGIHYEVDLSEDIDVHSFPGGNTGIFKHIVKYLIPNSIEGGTSFEEILYNSVDFSALDQPNNAVNIRLNATALDISHDGPIENADHVNVSYLKDGQIKKVTAKTVVMSIGGWVARNIVSDMPKPISEAYAQFYHSPVLVVNVALRHWRFLDELGISSGRLFDGFGDFFSIKRPMVTGDQTQPFDPDKPIVMTFYVPFTNSGFDIAEQGTLGRIELLSKSYADYEQEIVEQMTNMFSEHGFEAERDIAGIVLNRWGHAYISPQPGFHFDRDGKPAPRNIIKKGYGRIQFGHSELSGYNSHTRALNEGARAAREAMKQI
tara:strand:+ start:155038 stop:156954 length:1917 start_codon:yes stop_codon:yes gene_type:complete